MLTLITVTWTPYMEGCYFISHLFSFRFVFFFLHFRWHLLLTPTWKSLSFFWAQQLTQKQKTITSSTSSLSASAYASSSCSDRLRLFSYFPRVLTEIEEDERRIYPKTGQSMEIGVHPNPNFNRYSNSFPAMNTINSSIIAASILFTFLCSLSVLKQWITKNK